MRILCWLNISASKNIICDSGLIQTIQMIDGILKKRNDYHFYLLIPDWVSFPQWSEIKTVYPVLTSDHVSIKFAPMSPIRRLIPYEFNWKALMKVLDIWHTDYDLIYNALPEYTMNLTQLLCRNTQLGWGHANIPVVNRWHWILSNDYITIPDDRIEFRQCEGYLFSQYNLTLCKYTETMIKSMMNRWFPHIKVETRTLYNGIDYDRILSNEPATKTKNTVYKLLFPNRLQTFKNPLFTIENLLKLREKRKDFELILTDPTADFTTNNVLKNRKLIKIIKENSDWIKVIPVSGDDYIKLIYECDVVINSSNYETWCVAITEALACGKNCVVPSGLTFEEMISPNYTFIYKMRNGGDFLSKIEYALYCCNDQKYIETNRNYGKLYAWDNVIDSYIDLFEEIRQKYIYDKNHESPDRKRLRDWIIKKGYATKKEIQDFLGPGEEKCWTKYRWYLLQQGIKDAWDRGDPVYYVGDKLKIGKQLSFID